MRLSSLMGVVLLLWGCSKVNNSTTKIFGHAATGLQNPNAIYHDNSLDAIRYASSLTGCSGVEVDVRMDAQGKLWLFHDDLLDEETNLSGSVEEMTTDELMSGHYRTLKKEPLLKLDAATTAELSQGNTFLDLKIPGISKAQEIKSALLALDFDTTKFALIVSSLSYVDVFKYDFQVFLSINDVTELTSELIANEPRIRGICIRSTQITREEINFLKSINKEVICYEVRSPKGIKMALTKNPTYLLTDDLKLTLGLRY
ncbi:MAG: glycerophosphodiester phosphodiesterase [Flavobacteriales bacterium]|jgi:glycerophosphoryl diester phosphodiesterase